MQQLGKASSANIETWLETINTYNSTPEFGTTRVLFTEPEVGARNYVKGEMKKLGMTIHEDAIGNIFGVYPGTDATLPPVWTGSHIDTVLNAGMFDGMSGVVAGLEAVRLIREAGISLRRSLVVVVYTSEEPTRFKLGCLGSRALAGKLDAAEAATLHDAAGTSLYEVLEQLGFPVQDFDLVKRTPGDVFAAVELHIDQTGVLERAGKTVGIVGTGRIGMIAAKLFQAFGATRSSAASRMRAARAWRNAGMPTWLPANSRLSLKISDAIPTASTQR